MKDILQQLEELAQDALTGDKVALDEFKKLCFVHGKAGGDRPGGPDYPASEKLFTALTTPPYRRPSRPRVIVGDVDQTFDVARLRFEIGCLREWVGPKTLKAVEKEMARWDKSQVEMRGH